MSTQISNQFILSIPRSLKVIGLIAGVCILFVLLALIAAYLLEYPASSQLIDYLSRVRVTPAWPQIDCSACIGNP